MKRMLVIRRLIETANDQVGNASYEELLQMQKQQAGWLQELQSINEQLLTLNRDRMMQASVERVEQGLVRLGIRRE